MSRFAEKVVIVTGSSNGIGRIAALFFAQEGAKVTVTGRNVERLEITRKLISDAGVSADNINVVAADVTTSEGQDKILNTTLAKFGKLDILINNAGAAIADPSGAAGSEMSLETLDKNFNSNTRSVVSLIQKCKPHLIESKGEIVNISSIAATDTAVSKFPYYAMAKAALDQYTRAIAEELIVHGVRVNSIRPGIVRTGFASAIGFPETAATKMYNYFEGKRDCIPAGVSGKPEDIAHLILFLADRKQSSYIIGQTIVADGGSTLVMGLHTHDMLKALTE
ncbi:unnamed protein product [Caenorhabditis bovis]|uniref:Uncharacterized protein n=1 Tax=Caenorhabditis bovis TaxID=2654633 RepID=A0A8S1EBT9_9PELO|nr:unnamed protein product [Caenorhabditis bovis]